MFPVCIHTTELCGYDRLACMYHERTLAQYLVGIQRYTHPASLLLKPVTVEMIVLIQGLMRIVCLLHNTTIHDTPLCPCMHVWLVRRESCFEDRFSLRGSTERKYTWGKIKHISSRFILFFSGENHLIISLFQEKTWKF